LAPGFWRESTSLFLARAEGFQPTPRFSLPTVCGGGLAEIVRNRSQDISGLGQVGCGVFPEPYELERVNFGILSRGFLGDERTTPKLIG